MRGHRRTRCLLIAAGRERESAAPRREHRHGDPPSNEPPAATAWRRSTGALGWTLTGAERAYVGASAFGSLRGPSKPLLGAVVGRRDAAHDRDSPPRAGVGRTIGLQRRGRTFADASATWSGPLVGARPSVLQLGTLRGRRAAAVPCPMRRPPAYVPAARRSGDGRRLLMADERLRSGAALHRAPGAGAHSGVVPGLKPVSVEISVAAQSAAISEALSTAGSLTRSRPAGPVLWCGRPAATYPSSFDVGFYVAGVK